MMMKAETITEETRKKTKLPKFMTRITRKNENQFMNM